MALREKTTFQFFWQDRVVPGDFRSGVSLHSHTMYSEESLNILPRYTGKVPLLRRALDKNVDYARAYWTPPLSPRQAHRLEEKQIQRRFRLPGLVSLTDHDNIQAGMMLRVLDRFRHAPVSTEWTIPFGPTFFHLGIHNMPAALATSIMGQLNQFTADPNRGNLGSCLALLSSFPDVLLVLNHPLWDEKGIGANHHGQALQELLRLHTEHFHALELNGLRSWKENQQVIKLGQQTGKPLVGGGDRHGREPNAILNLSRGSSLVEFIHEVRYQNVNHVVFMPQYHESLTLRMIQTAIDILRDYPEVFEGRRTWPERVFYRGAEGTVPVSMASIWPNGNTPGIFKAVTLATRIAQTGPATSVLRLAFDDRARVWRNFNMEHEAAT
jgi:hypothetical protein